MPLLGSDPGRRDRPIRTGRRDKPIIQLPSVALRVLVVVGVAAVLFGVVFFRLWFLQILSGEEFVARANDNRLKEVKIVAPRGNIVDRKGKVIVTNRAGHSVGIRLMDVPEGQLDEEIKRLAKVLKIKPRKIREEIMDYLRPSTWELGDDGEWKNYLTWKKVRDGDITGLALIVVKEDVSDRIVSYLKERTLDYPGVEIQEAYLRSYPLGTFATQVLGHLGGISAEELKERQFKGYSPDDVVGKEGLEKSYDKWLRGRDGVARIEVDAYGRPKQTDPVSGRMPESGDTLVTTLDAKVQAAAERALQEGIALARENHQYDANGGAAVVLDVKNGDVLAMASYPTYDPEVWVGGLSVKDNKALQKKSANLPMLNRPIMEAKAVGSTFKPITATAALEELQVSSGTTFYCPGVFTSAFDQAEEKQKFYCFVRSGHGSLSMIPALAQSCDVYFYNLGDMFYNASGTPLQEWAKRLGLGKATGIDIPGEAEGRVPTKEWRESHYEAEVDKYWKPGNSIQLAIGQDDLEVTPLQLAVAYAAIANGGKIVTPHLGLKITNAAGETVRELRPGIARTVDVAPSTLDVVRQGLYQAAAVGTSAEVFAGYGKTVAGKTGTAQVWDDSRQAKVDWAWYASYAPYENPRYAVVVMIEKGGFGGSVAAPATRIIYDALFGIKSGEYQGSNVQTD